MISSGTKRGLAAVAVSALAVTGVPFLATSASAQPLSSQAAALTLVSPSANGTPLSAKNDGTNTTVRLEAIGPASVTSVTFQYSLGGGTFTDIGTATSDNGAFSLEWNPSAIAGATNVTIRATTGGTSPVNSDITGVDINNTLETVNITDGDSVGVFQSPYGGGEDWVALSGTKSTPSNAGGTQPDVAFWDGAAFSGATTATGTTAHPGTDATGTWATVLDIDGYPFGGASDQLLVNATDGTDGTEDAEAFTVYKQTITTVTATAAKSDVPAGSPATDVTVTVLDQNGKPVAGARVRNSDGTQTQTTDGNGEATFSQNPGADYYYADATNAPGYNPELGDKKSDTVTITQYSAAPSSLSATSVDGAAFDINEYAAGDISVQVKDQKGANFDTTGQTVSYYWVRTPFDGSAAQRYPSPTGVLTQPAEVGGKYTIPLPDTQDGTYELYASLGADLGGNGAISESKVLTVKAGDSTLAWKTGSPAQAKAGGSVDVTGSLTLADGTGLAGRSVQVDYNNGGGNAGIVQANGTTAGSRTVTTGADGTFTVTIRDTAATPQPEESGTLDAMTVAGTSDSDNPGETAPTLAVQFRNDLTPATVTITPTNGLNINGGNSTTPGEIKDYAVEVRTADDPNTPGDQSVALTNQTVTLTLDHGYFTDGTPAATPVVGADAGAWKQLGTNNGQSLEVTTNGSGVANVMVSIGRDAGFDDDGDVTSTLSATAGAVTKTDASQVWSSDNPLNGGEVKFELAPQDRQDGPVDPSPLTNEPIYDTFTTDQFGNLVDDAEVNPQTDDPDAYTFGSDFSDLDNRGDFGVHADRAGTYEVTGEWTTPTYKFTNVNGATAVDSENVEGSTDVEFYAVDFAASTFTITSDPEGEVPVGTAVTETVTVVDQEGNPVPNLDVQFIRQGPSDQSGDSNYTTTTNANGQAFYSFTGTKAGTARISAVISNDTATKTITDEVAFKAPAKEDAKLKVNASSSGKKDKIKANAIADASGATATLWVNGKKVASKKLDGDGDATFSRKDMNGKKSTKYTVKISGTKLTKKDSASDSTK